MRKEKALTRKEEIFCLEIFKGTKPTDAYLTAYPDCTSDRNKACKKAGELRNKLRVQKYLEALKAPAITAAQIKASEVMQYWFDIATADPSDLMQLQRRCCRYCYGKGHRYQWTENEYADAVAKAITAAKGNMPDDFGGDGFDSNLPAVLKCPECFGDGVVKIVFADTRNLTGKAKALFAGIKQNSSGAIEILTRNQDAALENIAKYLGMFKLRLEGAEDSIPIGLKFAQMTKDPIQAAQKYQELMSGK